MIAKLAQKILQLIMPQILEHLLKVFKMDKLLEYMEMPNELDDAVDEIKIELNAVKSVFTGIQDQIDGINKMAHPPKEFTKDIDSLKNQITDMKTKVSGFTAIFNKMKKLPLLKTIFK